MRIVLTITVMSVLLLVFRRKLRRNLKIGFLIAYTVAVLVITLGTRSYESETYIVLNPFRGYVVMLQSCVPSTDLSDFLQRIGWCKGLISGIILNTLLFIPLGFIVPSCFADKRWWSWWKVLLLGFAFSLTIEGTQLLTHLGWFDTGDLLHNTVGALIGYGLFQKVILPDRKEKAEGPS